jgi:hypothetical protein
MNDSCQVTSNDISLCLWSTVRIRTIPVLAPEMGTSHEIGVLYSAGATGGGGCPGWEHHEGSAVRGR